jgi:ribosome maturation factor RimP
MSKILVGKITRKSKILSLTLIIMVIILGISACQPTPNKEIVINKNASVLNDSIQNADDVQFDENQSKVALDYISENWIDKFDNDKGNLSVAINATINYLDTLQYPIVSVSPLSFSQEFADKVIDYFLKGETLYDIPEIKTKAMIEEEIINIKKEIVQLEELKKSDPDIYAYKIKDRNSAIDRLKLELANAPEICKQNISSLIFTTPPIPEDYTLSVSSGGMTEKQQYKKAVNKLAESNKILIDGWKKNVRSIEGDAWVDSEHVELKIINHSKKNSQMYFKFINESDTPLNLTIDESEKIASDAIDFLGINDMDIISANKIYIVDSMGDNRECTSYVFQYGKLINGIETTYDYPRFISSMYDEPWYTEKLEIIVDNRGISSFIWNYTSELTNDISKSVEIMNIEDIKSSLRNNILIQNTWEQKSEIQKRTINIDEIKLGMMRIKQKDENDSYIMLPVWDFFGYINIKFNNGQEDKILDQYNSSLLTINAIDGSIIDPSLGY